ncbi:hypothetical protein N7490_012117 [Penicillium lividum]|nr:hypothetical protein N7490_012117 [Penicillium lividum]
MAALGATDNSIEAIRTPGGMMVDDAISLKTAEEESPKLALQKLKHLSVKISSAHTQDDERRRLEEQEEETSFFLESSVIWNEWRRLQEARKNRLLPLLAVAASSLESLELTMRRAGNTRLMRREEKRRQKKRGIGLVDQNFEWISQHFIFLDCIPYYSATS